MQQVELYEFINSVHRSPWLDDRITAVKFCKSLKSCKRRHQAAEKGMTKRGGAWGEAEI